VFRAPSVEVSGHVSASADMSFYRQFSTGAEMSWVQSVCTPSNEDLMEADRIQIAPLPQIDIVGAVVIVWRVRGKIIRSVLCNIVCNNCAQCYAHTYEQT